MEMGGIFFKNLELYPPLQLGSGEYAFQGSVKKHCVAKYLLAIQETFSYENHCSFKKLFTD